MALHPTSFGPNRPRSGSETGRAIHEWIERWQAGIEMEESFHQIFCRYSRLVFSFFAKRGFSTEECQDLVQETFLRVYRSLGTFRGDARFETWLWQIAANVYRNTLRSQSTQKRDAEMVGLDEPLGGAPEEGDRSTLLEAGGRGPLDGVLADERSKLLRSALEDLPVQMRRCVLLRVDQDLKYREIADLMKVSIDTVKAHLFQARQALKSKLGDYFDDPGF